MKYFDLFSEGGYHTAIMTTYAFGSQAFEDIVFPKLRATGCRNIVVLADRQMVNQNLSEFGAPRFAGSSYHLMKVDAPGAFHPKITLLLGAAKGRVMVGSANLTALGLGGNKELIASVPYTTEQPDHTNIFADALSYIMKYVPSNDPWFQTSIQRALRNSLWLQNAMNLAASGKHNSRDLVLVHDRPDDNILEQIKACIENDPIERLLIISPYWDSKLDGLTRLRAALGQPSTHILIQNDMAGFPSRELHRHNGVEMFNLNSDSDSRFVHAKLILAFGKSWDHVVSGSINCTFPALMGPATPTGNAEAGIYKRIPRGTALKALNLEHYMDDPLNEDDLNNLDLVHAERSETKSCQDGGIIVLQSTSLHWTPPPQLVWETARIEIYGAGNILVEPAIQVTASSSKVWDVPLGDMRPKSAKIFFDSGLPAIVQVTDLDALAVTTLPTQQGRKKHLAGILAETFSESLDLIEALNQLEALDAEDGGILDPKSSLGSSTKADKQQMPQYEVLSYEDFVRARTTARSHENHVGLFMNGRHDSAANIISGCLNRLIGLVGPDLNAVEDNDIERLNAIDFNISEPQEPHERDDSSGPQLGPKHVHGKHFLNLATAHKLQDAVSAFEERCENLKDKEISTAEIVRLRTLLQIIICHAQPVRGTSQRSQILPIYSPKGYDWPRLVGRLLRQHFSSTRFFQKLRLEQDESEQRRIIEYLAMASWTASVALSAISSNKSAGQMAISLQRLNASLQIQVQAILSTLEEDRTYYKQVCEKLDNRFGSYLGCVNVR